RSRPIRTPDKRSSSTLGSSPAARCGNWRGRFSGRMPSSTSQGTRSLSPAGSRKGKQKPPTLPPVAEERKVVTVIFADVVGFTERAEQLDPEDARELLSRWYSCARAEVERFGGLVDKFIGDAVMGLFGVPVARGDDSERAVR